MHERMLSLLVSVSRELATTGRARFGYGSADAMPKAITDPQPPAVIVASGLLKRLSCFARVASGLSWLQHSPFPGQNITVS